MTAEPTAPVSTAPGTSEYLARRQLRGGTAGWTLLAGLGVAADDVR